jgi:hypothetical protein
MDREAAQTPGTALLKIMRLAWSSLVAPQLPPHPDLMHLETLRKMCLTTPLSYLFISCFMQLENLSPKKVQNVLHLTPP